MRESTAPLPKPSVMSMETWGLRQGCLLKYGGHCVCPCGCRDDNLRCLQFDHIDGGGTKERLRMRGNKLYAKLATEPVDEGLRVLCANCHFQHSQFGHCNVGSKQEKSNDGENLETTPAERNTRVQEHRQPMPVTPPVGAPWEDPKQLAAWHTFKAEWDQRHEDPAFPKSAPPVMKSRSRGWGRWFGG